MAKQIAEVETKASHEIETRRHSHFNLVRGLRLHLLGRFEQFKEEKNSNDQHKWTLRDQQQADCPRRQGRVAGRRRRRRRW